MRENDTLVVAVHPDDETLGCGGTLLRLVAEGHRIHWVIVTEMIPGLYSPEQIQRREVEISEVSSAFGFTSVHRLGFPTTLLDEQSDAAMVGALSKVLHEVRPQALFLPFKSDVHSDHRKTYAAGMACIKTFRYPFIRKVMMMEVPSETEFAPALPDSTFSPNVFRDISSQMERKIEIFQTYKSEVAEAPFPRSIEKIRALASWRGSAAGCSYAEAFMLLKDIE